MANPNPTSFDEREEKKWIISRIIYVLEQTIQEIHLAHEKLEKLSADEREKIQSRRNNIISPAGIFLTILLALYSIEKIDDNTFFILLIIDVIFGVVVYYISNIYLRSTSTTFRQISNDLMDCVTKLSFPLGFINARGANVETTDFSFLQNFLFFAHFISLAQTISIKNSFDIHVNKKFLTIATRATCMLNSDNYKKLIDSVISKIESYNPHKDIPSLQYEEAKAIIDSYKKNL